MKTVLQARPENAARPSHRLFGAARTSFISKLLQLRAHSSLSSGASDRKLTFIRCQSLRAGSLSCSTATLFS
jgi:hypothetical protein